jgi:hypothetical protein
VAKAQVLDGIRQGLSFEYALNEVVQEHLDLPVFEHRYRVKMVHNIEKVAGSALPKGQRKGLQGQLAPQTMWRF